MSPVWWALFTGLVLGASLLWLAMTFGPEIADALHERRARRRRSERVRLVVLKDLARRRKS